MEYDLSDTVTLSVTPADFGANAEIQILITDPDTEQIVERGEIASVTTDALKALGLALTAQGEAIEMQGHFYSADDG